MEIGIALDGEGRLGRPAAVTAVAQAADRLGYGSVWCLGPWAPTLAGAVAAVTDRVRIGLEGDRCGSPSTIAPHRLVVVDRLPLRPAPTDDRQDGVPPGPVLLEVRATELDAAVADLCAAWRAGATEVVVRLVGDPGVDEALAAYAGVGELVEGAASACG